MARGSGWLKRAITGACVALLVVILGGCSMFSGPQAVNHPAGSNMQTIWNLFVPIFWMSVVVFIIVQGVLIYSVIRFRRKPGSPEPHPTHGNTKLEITWTILPALILAVITVPTLATISSFAKKPGAGSMTVQVVGHQWWWEFDYPGQGVVVADEMHIPIGVPIEVELRSNDVIHSFWVPKLAGKQDVVPNQHNHLSFTANEIGTFRGQCAEFCGAQHANMAFTVVVQSQADYDAWLAKQKLPATNIPSSDQLVAQGKQVFFTAGCVGCHTINGAELNGVQALGIVGPNLTHVGSRTGLAGEVLTQTQANIATWVHNPQKVKPGTLMPNLGLTVDQANAVAAYLESLK
ncbi:MAG TPA: cytochrome c oxidase subunit II [Nitrolancea sp.]|nr:cytochrome c oxidase subunit II [Nitrolancea sp.]